MWELTKIGLFLVFGLPVLFLIIFLVLVVFGGALLGAIKVIEVSTNEIGKEAKFYKNWWNRFSFKLRFLIVFSLTTIASFLIYYFIDTKQDSLIAIVSPVSLIGIVALPLMLLDEIAKRNIKVGSIIRKAVITFLIVVIVICFVIAFISY